MKKLKLKFKRALAGFLRDELLEVIGYNHRIPLQSLKDRFVINEVPFETMCMEMVINLYPDIDVRHRLDSRFEAVSDFERQVREAKEQFCFQMMDHIHVDAQDLVSPEYRGQRSVRLMLQIQSKK